MRHLILLIAALFAVGACGREPRVQTVGSIAENPPESGANYRLGVGDKVKVTVLGQPDLSGESEVDAGGKIVVPLAGAIDAVDATVMEVSQRIQTAFSAAQILREPKVAVQVTEYRPVTVTGEVKTPGRYKFSFGMDVRSAVALGGGFEKRANKGNVVVYRDNKPYTALPESQLEPGDTVEVARR